MSNAASWVKEGAIARAIRARPWLMLTCALMLFAHFAGVMRPLDNALAAVRAQMLQRDASGSLVLIQIDTESLRRADRWPWPRERFAQVLRNLDAAGATLVAFDVDFSLRSDATQDVALGDAIDADPGAVVLPTFVQADGTENSPLASIAENALVGSVNVPVDRDGRVRRYYRAYADQNGYRPTIAAIAAGVAYGEHAPFLIDYGIRAESIDSLSFEDVYTGRFDPALVRNRIVMIGATALELGDEFATPVRPTMPGLVVHALAYESLAQGRALGRPADFVILAVALLALAGLWPPGGALDLGRLFVRQTAVLSAALLGPLALQAAAPLSMDTGLVLLAQAVCILASVRQELNRRAAELVSQREAHLNFVALHDPETELPNRRAMIEAIRRRLGCPEDDRTILVLAVGIERFSTLRGAVGYGNANRAVRALAPLLCKNLSDAEAFHLSTSTIGIVTSARRGLTPGTFGADLLDRLRYEVEIDSQPIVLLTRVGAAHADAGFPAAETMLERASLALDQARLKGRQLVTYSEGRFPDPKLQLALISDIHAGLGRGEFRVVYQAKTSARDGKVIGAEALLRWRHPRHGDVAPDRFIQAAEETGAIDQLTRWMVRQVIKDQQVLRGALLDFPLSVNISGRSISDAALCDFLLAETRAANACLCFEVTETAVVDDPLAAIEAITAFQAAGHLVAIDDYGVGLSSLAYLKEMPVDELKLDKSLVQQASSSTRDRLILKSTIDLAHSLDMSVVAEGVEDDVTLAMLQTMGCDYVQGFLIAPPSPLSALIDLCASRQPLHAAKAS